MTFDVFYSALSIVVLMLFSSSNVCAENVATPYQGAEIAVFTPWSFFQKSVQNTLTANKSVQQNLGDLDWNLGGLNWHLTNVQWSLNAEFEQGNLTAQTYDLRSKQLGLTLSVGKISLNQIVEQVVDGVQIKVQVQAECGPLNMSQSQAQAAAQVTYNFSSTDVSTQLNQFDLQWPAQSWQVSAITCQGPSGFNDLLQTKLMQSLVTSDAIRPWLQSLLAQTLQSRIESLLAKLKTPTALSITQSSTPLNLTFKSFQNTSAGILSLGALSWSGNADETGLRPFDVKNLPADFASDTPVLLTRQEAWIDLVQAQLAARPDWTTTDLRKQDSFLSILNSRFLQFFLWPDLWNYPKSNPFTLAVSKPQKMLLSWNADGSANVSLTTSAWLQSLRDGQWWNYIYLNGSAKGTLVPSVQNGQLSVQARVSGTLSNVRFGQAYTQQYAPNTWLATGIAQDFMNDLGSSLGYSAALPTLDLGDAGQAKANGWSMLGQGFIEIPFN